MCGQITESHREIEKCSSCSKSFLPLNYFHKIHNQENAKYKDLFAESYELNESDLIRGIFVLW